MAPIAPHVDAAGTPLPTVHENVRRVRSWDLPLLTKELLELAARPRTYQLRVAYALALLVISYGVLIANVPRRGTSIVSQLGYGGPVLTSLNLLQELGLYLVLPVLACSTLTVEKERKTLDLLLITKLGPWTIIFEKFLSQVIAAVNLLLLSLPLLAFSYSLGGISPEQLWISLLGLFLTIIRLAAVGIFCSAVFRTTAQALLGTYALTVFACVIEQMVQSGLIPILNGFHQPLVGLELPRLVNILFESPGILTLLRSNLILAHSADIPILLRIVCGCLPSLLCSFAFIALARWFLVPPPHGWLAWGLQHSGGATRRTRIPRDERDVPDDEPIAWREGPRGSHATWWKKNASLAGIPLLLLLVALRWSWSGDEFRFILGTVYFVIWLAVSVRLCSHGDTLFIQERTHQTLELLCCTPMTSEEIVRQKMRSLQRAVQISRIPLIVCVVVRTACYPSIIYLFLSAFMIGLYPALIACQALSFGLGAKNGASAILKALMAIAGWCFLPYLVIAFVSPVFIMAGQGAAVIFAFIGSFSPLTLLGFSEIFPGIEDDMLNGDDTAAAMFVVLIIGTIVTHGLRYLYLLDWPIQQANLVLRGSTGESSRYESRWPVTK